jgi:hypothetical protein
VAVRILAAGHFRFRSHFPAETKARAAENGGGPKPMAAGCLRSNSRPAGGVAAMTMTTKIAAVSAPAAGSDA